MFTNEQIESLQAPLKRENVKSRDQSGRKLSYIEGWKAIEEANRIFGFDAWDSETVETRMVAEGQRKIGAPFDRQGNPQKQKDGWGVSYIAKVRIKIGDLVREGVGAGHGIDVDLGLAHESAIKEAETDARKRALMTFGYPFGLALYDKTQENVETAAPARQEPPREQAPRDTRPAPAAPQRHAGSISDRAAVPRATSGPQRQSPPADDNPFAPTEAEIAAYIAQFQTASDNCETVADIENLWKSQAKRRFELGVAKGEHFAKLAAIAEKREAAIITLSTDLIAAE